MSVKVQLGFTSAGASAPFFTFDSVALGTLDAAASQLGGGQVLVDVSAYVRDFNTTRGKTRELDRFQAGQATVSFNNSNRIFDPTFEASPFFGQIEPRRQMVISVDDIVQYEGTIDDWNIGYEQGGNSVAVAIAFDGIANLANIKLQDFTPSGSVLDYKFFILNDATRGKLDEANNLLAGTDGVVTTGRAINSALDHIEWPESKRDLDTGEAVVESDPIANDTVVLDYLQKVATSEPSGVFISKTGDVKFIQRNSAFLGTQPFFSDDGTGIPYSIVSVIFGTELLYNEVIVTNSSTQASLTNETSTSLYGKRDLLRETFLNSFAQLAQLAGFLIAKFSQPEFRFEVIEVNLDNLDATQRAAMLNLELGDVVQVKFTPSDIPPAIERYGEVISTKSRFTPTSEIMQIGLQSVQGALIVLDTEAFGKLNSESVLGF
jgi:hypothetical protein